MSEDVNCLGSEDGIKNITVNKRWIYNLYSFLTFLEIFFTKKVKEALHCIEDGIQKYIV